MIYMFISLFLFIKITQRKKSNILLLITKKSLFKCSLAMVFIGARDVMAIVVGNEHADTSSNHGRDWLNFTLR